MANKDALRDLQVRLANRLREAREQPRQVGWLAVECGGNGLLMPLAQAGEIHPLGRITKVPHAKPWLAGVANLRGELYAVVDLPVFLGLQESAKAAGPAQGQLVALNASLNLNAALRVDRLVGLRDPEHMKVEHSDAPAPALCPQAGEMPKGGCGRPWTWPKWPMTPPSWTWPTGPRRPRSSSKRMT
ncbi:chemotaxis protein CheW [Ideonella paludis]|uniref:chemotaxis protein CheW n=1 Tax=Ideonella paludis TaxID=1233411 RepID=UPI00363DCFA2